MKFFSKLLFIAVLVFGLSACTDILTPKDPVVDEVPVQIYFSMADKVVQTKSKVSGTDPRVHIIQMVCFDANGLYLGIRDAESVTPEPTVDIGIIKGSVPQGTARIHFIANRNLTKPLSHTLYTPEEVVMNSDELSTLYSDNPIGTGNNAHQEICYWGYHREESEAAMRRWLKPKATDPQSLVYLIRDRAKVVLTYTPTGNTDPVKKIEWLIHNGRVRGYLAPKSSDWGEWNAENEVYIYKYYGQVSHGGQSYLLPIAGMNEYTTCPRYSLWISETQNDERNFDTAYDVDLSTPNTLIPQFLFDDDNEAIDDLKVILRVTYTTKTVYHTLRLNDDDKNRYDIVRNNTYYIKATNLSPDVAFYETLEKAINGDEFVNADVEVDRTIPDISDDKYTLQIKLPNEGTSIVLNTEGVHEEMQFVFRNASDLSEVTGTTTPNEDGYITAFNVHWEKTQTFCTNPTVKYDPNTKQFVISTEVIEGKLSDKLQSQWLVVEYTYTGSDNKAKSIKRYIHVYVIDQFQYLGPPTLKKVDTSNSNGPDEYVLSFKIPKEDYTDPDNPDPNEWIYPTGLYPIDVKFATNTLNAYGISQGVENYGLFGVSVETTSNLLNSINFESGYDNPVSTESTSNISNWYFQQANNHWDFWYTYSLKQYPTNGDVNIYFKDVTDHIKYANVNEVGLFLYVEYFGKVYSIPVTTTTNP